MSCTCSCMFFTYYDAYVTIGFGKNKRRNFTKEGEAYLCLNGYLSAAGFGSATLQFFGVGFGAEFGVVPRSVCVVAEWSLHVLVLLLRGEWEEH